MADLPYEIWQMILNYTSPLYSQVINAVCKLWKELFNTPPNMHICGDAAEDGYFEVLEWARKQCYPWGIDFCECAVLGGRLDILEWAVNRGCVKRYRAIWNAACQIGRIDILEQYWLVIKGIESPDTWKFRRWTAGENNPPDLQAAKYGQICVLEWLLSKGRTIDGRTIAEAANAGQLDTVMWLCRYFKRRTHASCNVAKCAKYPGGLETLKWIEHNYGYAPCKHAFEYAAAGGQLDTLKWLFSIEGRMDADHFIQYAASHGHMHVIEWLESQCSILPTSLSGYELQEYPDVMKWMNKNNISVYLPLYYSSYTLHGVKRMLNARQLNIAKCQYYVTLEGNLEVLQWLRKKGIPWHVSDEYFEANALKYGYLNALAWARKNGIPKILWDALYADVLTVYRHTD